MLIKGQFVLLKIDGKCNVHRVKTCQGKCNLMELLQVMSLKNDENFWMIIYEENEFEQTSVADIEDARQLVDPTFYGV